VIVVARGDLVGEIVQHADVNGNDFRQLARRDVHIEFECFGRDYHKESMAESSSGSRLHWLTPDLSASVNDFLTLRTVAGNSASDLGTKD
jgi:hypothetical protein